jgi:hypothetical protein
MFFPLLFFPLWLGLYLYILYKLPSHSRKRVRYFMRTWVFCFGLEMVGLLFLSDEQMVYLGLQKGEGFWYWVMFTKGLPELLKMLLQGHRAPDFWLLLLIPVLPAVVAGWIGYREEQADKADKIKQTLLH